MKPRLCSAALTREDWEILVDIREHHQRWRGSNLLAMSQHSDRRDADLMYVIENMRLVREVRRPATYPNWPMVMTLMRGAELEGEDWP
jgi:hypothetical protein